MPISAKRIYHLQKLTRDAVLNQFEECISSGEVAVIQCDEAEFGWKDKDLGDYNVFVVENRSLEVLHTKYQEEYFRLQPREQCDIDVETYKLVIESIDNAGIDGLDKKQCSLNKMLDGKKIGSYSFIKHTMENTLQCAKTRWGQWFARCHDTHLMTTSVEEISKNYGTTKMLYEAGLTEGDNGFLKNEIMVNGIFCVEPWRREPFFTGIIDSLRKGRKLWLFTEYNERDKMIAWMKKVIPNNPVCFFFLFFCFY